MRRNIENEGVLVSSHIASENPNPCDYGPCSSWGEGLVSEPHLDHYSALASFLRHLQGQSCLEAMRCNALALASAVAWVLLVTSLTLYGSAEPTAPPIVPTRALPISSSLSSSNASARATSIHSYNSRYIGTCAYASINYITHRPSQCWKNSNFPTSGTLTAETNANAPTSSDGSDGIVLSNHSGGSLTTVSPAYSTVVTAGYTGPASKSRPGTRETDGSPIQATTALAPSQVVAVDVVSTPDLETESPLDNAKFLSFEDWKKQNLPPGQGEQDGRSRSGEGQPRARPGFDNTLDSLGDDGEIVLDFSGFGGSVTAGQQHSTSTTGDMSNSALRGTDSQPVGPRRRSKDAGKTCKERSNYASFDCGASVLKTNPHGKKASSILVENKDSYMLNECSADNKFLIVELCDEIKIDTLVLANFEFFSSIFRTFRASVSDRYPVKIDKWKDIGTFEARNSRDLQAFLVENHDGFARYVRLEFLSHYGSEFYCPISLLRVHGVTAFEEYKLEQLVAQGHDVDEEEEDPTRSESEDVESNTLTPSKEFEHSQVSTEAVAENKPSELQQQNRSSEVHSSYTAWTSQSRESSATEPANMISASPDICPIPATHNLPEALDKTSSRISVTTPPVAAQASSASSGISESSTADLPASLAPAKSSIASTGAARPSLSVASSKNMTASAMVAPATTKTNGSGSLQNTDSRPQRQMKDSAASTKDSESSGQTTSQTTASSATSPSPSPSLPSHPPSSSSSPAAPSSSAASSPPPTQESFFKSINKRLQFLEANSTLSLQYIESQSALLRDAFAKVEKRQVAKTTTFLEILNATVASELARFQNEYEQLWQNTLMELASQRDEGRRERELLGERVRILAEEMVSQKRLMAAQATILLLCLGLVVFARFGGMSGAIDSSLIQGMQEIVNRGKEARAREKAGSRSWGLDSPWTSPTRGRAWRGMPATPDSPPAPAEADDETVLSAAQARVEMSERVVEEVATLPSSPLSDDSGHGVRAEVNGRATQSTPTKPMPETDAEGD